jgi:alpha-1,2-mannosyltransferase
LSSQIRPQKDEHHARCTPRLANRRVRTGLVTGAIAVWTLVSLQLTTRVHLGVPLDFQVYRDASLNMLHRGNTYHERFTFVHLNFTYPPFALLLLSLLVVAPTLGVLSVWWLLSALALVALIALCLRELTSLRHANLYVLAALVGGASCLCLQPLRSNLNFGQINFLLMFAVACDVIRTRPQHQGVLTGLAAAIKLTPLIYVIYFFLIRARSAAWRAIGVFVGAAVIAWIVLPKDSATFWLHQAFSPERKGKPSNPLNQSWFGFTGHVLASSPQLRILLWVVLCALTLWCGLWLTSRYVAQHRPVDALLVLAVTEVLVSPISWAHHWSWIVLIPLVLFARWREQRLVAVVMVFVLAVGILAPYRWYSSSWCSHGVAYDVFGYSLVLSGALLLASMFLAQKRSDGSLSPGRRRGAVDFVGAEGLEPPTC